MATVVLKYGNYSSHLDLDYDFVVSGRNWSLYAALVFRTGNYNMGSWGAIGNTYIHTVVVGGGLPYTSMYSATTLIGRSFITSGTYPTNGAAPSVSFRWRFGVNSSWGGYQTPSGSVTVWGSAIGAINAPSVNKPSISSITDTSAKASFSVANNNGQSARNHAIDLSATNFGSTLKTISGTSGTFSGLTPNKTYYARARAANDGGTGYSAVASFTTTFNDPGSPANIVLSYDQSEPIPSANLQATWLAASAGSTPVAGYRLRLYKNDVQIQMIDTENTNISYTFGTFEELGFVPGDVAKVGIYAYSKDWQGNKHYSGGGTSSSQVYSNSVTEVSDKYVYVSMNGGAFEKYKMYMSINGGSFVEHKKEKFKIIQ